MPRDALAPITIVGLGPAGAKYLTCDAKRVLRLAPEIWLRTRHHPVGRLLSRRQTVRSFDEAYSSGIALGDAHEVIAQRVMALARRPQGVVYAVPGHPLVGEPTVRRIMALASAVDLAVHIVPGLSAFDQVCTVLRLDPLATGLDIIDATTLPATAKLSSRTQSDEKWHRLLASSPIRSTVPTLLCNLKDRAHAKQAVATLRECYPPEHRVTMVSAKPSGFCTVDLALSDLALQRRSSYPAFVFLPPMSVLADLSSFESLRHIVALLRAPGGCPWDREQTHQTLKPYLIEESYEVLEALDNAAMPELEEELGDLLLQVLLHAQLAAEDNVFDIGDVVAGIGAKLIRRHPHVFGSTQVAGSKDVLRNWEAIKQAEKGDARGVKTTLLGGLPREMPALSRARSIQRRVADLGFDWDDASGALAKVFEEAGELAATDNPAERRAELGDLLFALVSLGRFLDLDAEECLRLANERFVRRFHTLEEIVRQRGLALKELPVDEITRLWQLAKRVCVG